jgi:uncharacterized protein YfiM (DUF2279 family)
MGKSQEVKETPQQRALADVGKAQMADFKQRWLPVQQKFAAGVVAAGAPDSFQRRQAAAKAGVDTSVNFGKMTEKLDSRAAATGGFGSSAHKLGITGMAEDEATSMGLSTVAADQSVDDQYVAGLGAVNALGRGEKATAMSGMAGSAALSARQAQADAQASLENRSGNMQFAGTVIGAGAGLWSGKKPGGIGVTNDFTGVNGTNAMDKFLRYGTSGD